MLAPLSWLKDYVDIDITPEELEEKLFSCGFEVEGMTYVGKNIDKIVVCKILKIEPHPNADKLSVCQVDAGTYGKLQIITAAKNIAEGNLVPVALDGSTLANDEHIFNGELRGLPSYGMFCSGEELGIDDDFYEGAGVNGILIFNEEYPLGAEVKTVLGIEDVIFDISVTANRPDCQSIFGMAREVAAVLKKPLKMPAIDYKTDKNLKTTDVIKIEDKAFDLCPRYLGHYVDKVKIEKSPQWIRRRLASVGIRSINNIVDITNFVLTEIGQPMHAFDYNNIGGKQIIIRRATNGEKIVTLDEKEFTLNENNLVICDKDKPVALAGIMGGLNSEIEDSTEKILFEAAKFARDNIRKSSRALGQRSDSSARYEKGIDAYTAALAMDRALHLVYELNCGTIASDRYDLGGQPEQKIVKTQISRINSVLGIDVPAAVVEDILTRLYFECKIDGDNVTVAVPLFRDDVESHQDLAEEIIREYGYDHIIPTLMPSAKITNGGLNASQRDAGEIKEYFCKCGYNEIITYSFVSEKDFDNYSLPKEQSVKILNPLGEDVSLMRVSLLPSAVAAVAKNLNRKNNDGKLFELANVYTATKNGELPVQSQRLAFAAYGAEESFFTVKGAIQGLFATFAYGSEQSYTRSAKTYLHPTVSADISLDGEVVGSFGELHPETAEKYGIDKRVYVGEIDYDALKKHFTKKVYYKPISKFPTVERDLAVTVDKNVLCGDLISTIKSSGGEHLTEIKLFDIYEGDQVAVGKKSMAFNIVYSSLSRTLTVEEIESSIKDILAALRSNYGAELR